MSERKDTEDGGKQSDSPDRPLADKDPVKSEPLIPKPDQTLLIEYIEFELSGQEDGEPPQGENDPDL
ncbi:MAG TPA: hypothetical protein VGE98_13435 [Thermoanaerobaculia bacterium]